MVESHFLDSGAFTLQRSKVDRRQYLDAYGAFINKHKVGIDLYANVDIVGNPKATWDSQLYLEQEWGLSPVPVVHYGTDLKWLRRYVELGYSIVGLGGLVGSAGSVGARDWILRCFSEGVLNKIKFHGFGIANHRLLGLGWYSLDSASAVKEAARGVVFVPKKIDGTFDLTRPPIKIRISGAPSKRKNPKSGSLFFESLSPLEKRIVSEWFSEIGIECGADGIGCREARVKANIHYLDVVAAAVFEKQAIKSRGGFLASDRCYSSSDYGFKTKVYHSGNLGVEPEPDNVMLTFWEMCKGKPTSRFQRILEERRA